MAESQWLSKRDQFGDYRISASRNSAVSVSVLMSAYNSEDTLYRALESILAQSFDNFEVIVINDGSKDGTLEILLSNIDDARLRIIDQANIGLTNSLIRGVGEARGEFIARQDADDESLPGRLAAQFRIAKKISRPVVIGTEHHRTGEGNGEGYAVLERCELFAGNPFSHSSLFFSRLEGVNYDSSYPYAQDFDLLLRVARQFAVVSMEQQVVKLHRHSGMISDRHWRMQRWCALKARLAHYRPADGLRALASIMTAFVKTSILLGLNIKRVR